MATNAGGIVVLEDAIAKAKDVRRWHGGRLAQWRETSRCNSLAPRVSSASARMKKIGLILLAGFLAMFFIERFFCFHHHDAPEPNGVETSHACVHDHSDHTHDHSASPHALRWSGAAIGLTLHSLLDGVALAASVSVAHDDRAGPVAGLGTFLVVLLHKPFDSLTLGTLMAAGRQSALSISYRVDNGTRVSLRSRLLRRRRCSGCRGLW